MCLRGEYMKLTYILVLLLMLVSFIGCTKSEEIGANANRNANAASPAAQRASGTDLSKSEKVL
jgi:hypothetical protein